MEYKFNIQPTDCKFIINKEKQKIICVLEHTSNLFTDFINANSHLREDTSTQGLNLSKRLLMPPRFIGVATCGKDDEWNEEAGRIIAFSRMKDKVNKSFFKRANTYFKIVDQWLDDTMNILNALGAKLEVNTEKRHAYIEKLVGVEPTENE